MLGPVSSASTEGRSSTLGMPTSRFALAAAPGHSGYGSSPANASQSTMCNVLGLTVAAHRVLVDHGLEARSVGVAVAEETIDGGEVVFQPDIEPAPPSGRVRRELLVLVPADRVAVGLDLVRGRADAERWAELGVARYKRSAFGPTCADVDGQRTVWVAPSETDARGARGPGR